MRKIELFRVLAKNKEMYPELYSLQELKAMNLMPKKNVKPRAYVLRRNNDEYEKEFLYDIAQTEPFRIPKKQIIAEERAKRRLQKERTREVMTFEKKIRKIGKIESEIEPYQKLILDLETTGTDINKDEILQISILNEDGIVLLDKYIKPKNHTSWEESEKIHHITPEMVQDCETIDEVWEEVQRIIATGAYIIGYNVLFDIKMLYNAGIHFRGLWIDIQKPFAEIYGDWNPNKNRYYYKKLVECAKYYEYPFTPHNSLEDAKATLFCYQKIVDDWKRKKHKALDEKEIRLMSEKEFRCLVALFRSGKLTKKDMLYYCHGLLAQMATDALRGSMCSDDVKEKNEAIKCSEESFMADISKIDLENNNILSSFKYSFRSHLETIVFYKYVNC